MAKQRLIVPRRTGERGLRPDSLPADSNGVKIDSNGAVHDLNEPEYRRKEALDIYIAEIIQTKLLTRQEEIELAKRIKKGDKKAREHMIKANLRLVVNIGRDYEGMGLPLLDLISEGNIGLMKAVDRFDPAFGAKLSTYASWWIKQAIKKALADQGKTIRLPIHLVDHIRNMRRVISRLQEELEREPTDEELAEEMGMPIGRIKRWREASAASMTSLDEKIGDGEDSGTYADVIPDPNMETADIRVEKGDRVETIKKMLARLDPRELHIIKERFGLGKKGPLTLEEISGPLGVTRERIRQIQNVALKKLRGMMKHLEKHGLLLLTGPARREAYWLKPGMKVRARPKSPRHRRVA